ncbi:unnamed protein product, partial [Staurois parvus]
KGRRGSAAVAGHRWIESQQSQQGPAEILSIYGQAGGSKVDQLIDFSTTSLGYSECGVRGERI